MTNFKSMLMPTEEDVARASAESVPRKPLFRIDEAAELLRCSGNQVRGLLDSGKLQAILINSAVEPERKHQRVLRESIVRFLVARTGK